MKIGLPCILLGFFISLISTKHVDAVTIFVTEVLRPDKRLQENGVWKADNVAPRRWSVSHLMNAFGNVVERYKEITSFLEVLSWDVLHEFPLTSNTIFCEHIALVSTTSLGFSAHNVHGVQYDLKM